MKRWDRWFWKYIAPAMEIILVLIFFGNVAFFASIPIILIFKPCLILVCP